MNNTLKFFLKYLMVGSINTTLTLGIIFSMMHYGFNVYLTNFIGYLVGIIVSFILNSKITFKTKGKLRIFMGSMAASWVIQIMALKLLISLEVNEYLAQIVSAGVYVVCGFMLSKLVVFKV